MAYTENVEQIIIKTTPAFDKAASKLLLEDSLTQLYEYLAINPMAGDVIRGSGGIRKLRWQSKNNKGKSGGVRVLYHYSNDVLIIIITVFPKSNKDNISAAEKNELKKLMPKLIEHYMENLQ